MNRCQAAFSACALVLAGCASAATVPSAAPQAASSIPGVTPAGSSVPGASHCDAALWQHIYHPYRLVVRQACKTVTGTVDQVKREPDGDLHINVRVAASLVNQHNVTGEHGDLVVEAICTGTVTQPDAEGACAGFSHPVTVPAPGDRVRITGSYVLDKDHGWMEIHPVSSIQVLGSGPVSQPVTHKSSSAPQPTRSRQFSSPVPVRTHSAAPVHAACYPKSDAGNCYEPGEFCRKSDLGTSGIAGDGARITCTLSGGRARWE